MAYGATAEHIGGGEGYVSPNGFTESLAHYIPETLSDLNKALAEAKGEKLIWLPKVITVPTVANAGGRMILPNAINAYVASKRGIGGLKVTGTCSGAFATGIRVMSHAKLSGLTIEGPTNLGTPGSVGGCYTMFALKLSGAVDVEIEDCDLYNFPQGIISIDNILASGPEDLKWDSPNRVRILYSSIHGAQAHGWGYGVLQSNANGRGLAAWVYACKFWGCRHHIACDHGEPYSYEFDQCIFEDSWYWSANKVAGTKYYACQIDAHGSGPSSTRYAGRHYEGHDSSFSANGNKPNIGIRGIPSDQHRFYRNRTLKTNHQGIYPADGSPEVRIGQFVDLEASEGGRWTGANDMPKYRVFAYNNWYGAEAPPDDGSDTGGDTGGDTTPPATNSDIKVTGLTAPQVVVGETYTVTATVTNAGDGSGTASVVIGYINGKGAKVPLKTQSVTLEAGATIDVTLTGKATAAGDWTFYAGDQQIILKVVEVVPEPPAAPKFEVALVGCTADGNGVSVIVTVSNKGNADGTAAVKCGGETQSIEIPVGGERTVTFSVAVDVAAT
jgi:hypothetical protein